MPRRSKKVLSLLKKQENTKKKEDVTDTNWLATDLQYGGIDWPRRDNVPSIKKDKKKLKKLKKQK